MIGVYHEHWAIKRTLAEKSGIDLYTAVNYNRSNGKNPPKLPRKNRLFCERSPAVPIRGQRERKGMMLMKKKLLWTAALTILALLIFRSRIWDGMENWIFTKSEISQTKEYQTYRAYSAAGKLTEQGYYEEETSDETAEAEPVVPVGMAHVTFAENSFLNVEYFSNGDGSAYLSTDDCYLAPGAHIYAKVVEQDGPSSMYEFDRFRVWRYTDSGRKEVETSCEETDGIIEILEITEADADTELSIEPLGKYETRELMLDAYTEQWMIW